MQEFGRDADDVGLNLAEAGERDRVECIVVEEHERHRRDGLVSLGPGVVDHAEGSALLPAHVVGSFGGEGRNDLIGFESTFSQHGRSVGTLVGGVRGRRVRLYPAFGGYPER